MSGRALSLWCLFACWLLTPLAAAQTFRVIPQRVAAWPGARIIVPVVFDRPADARRPWPAFTEDGLGIATEVFWVVSTRQQAVAPMARWLAPTETWRSVPIERVEALTGEGFVVLALQLPPQVNSGGVRVGRTVIPLVWHDAERALPPVESGLDAAQQREIASALGADPIRIWRSLLLMSRLDPADEALFSGIDDPIARGFARQRAAYWSTALARLQALDPELASAFLRRLTISIRMNPGLVVPAWRGDDADLQQLADHILDPTSDAARVRSIVRDWLSRQPGVLSWVVDDSGEPAGPSAARGTIGIANLTETRLLTWIEETPGLAKGEPTTADPFAAHRLEVISRPEPRTDAEPFFLDPTPVVRMRDVAIRLGRMSMRASIAIDPLSVSPPGFTVARLLPEWSLADWLAGTEVPAETGDPAAAFRIHRVPPRVIEDSGGEAGVIRRPRVEPGRWAVYFESRGGGAGELVRLWIGSRGRPTHLIRVQRSDGVADDELTPGLREAWPCRVADSGDVFSFELEIPDEALGGSLRLGLEHYHGAGRSAWPRRMFPWQSEPGRVVLDLGTWRPLGR